MPSKKIIIIDDESMIVNLCKRVLTGEGYEATGVSSGEEALKTCSQEHFHMVITDMLMPEMDGLETFHALRDINPGIIGVLITGHGTIDMAIQAMDRGLSGFVRKPFTPRELARAVKDAFARTALSDENIRLKALFPLYALTERFISSKSVGEILDGLVEVLSQQTGAQRISVMMYNAKEDLLRIESSRGIDKEIALKVRVKPGEKISGRVFLDGKPLIINGGPDDNPRIKYLLASKDIVAAISFPLKARYRTLGVLNISKVGKGTFFSESDIEMVSIVCRQAVVALENFEAMEEKAENTRVKTLLEQYLAPEVIEMLLSRGQDLLEVGEIRTVSILFADIRNFTPLVQQIPLKTIRSFLNDFFGQFTEIIFKFNGTMNKFLGDAALAFFGAPVSIAEPESASVDSAVLMHEKFYVLQEKWAGENRALRQIGLGIGVSSGEVFLGNVGSRRRLDYTVIGTDVNIAQRLSSEAASGEILVSEPIQRQLGSRFRIINQSLRKLKGMDTPIAVFSIATSQPLLHSGGKDAGRKE